MRKNYPTIWKPVQGYEGYYEINNNGIVKSINRTIKFSSGIRTYKEKYLKTRLNNSGYLEIRLSKEGVTQTKFIHILLSEIFIPNPFRKLEVNHKNGIKTDNRLQNLEWVTHSENIQHAYDTGLLVKMSKPVIDTCTGETYKNTGEAAKATGINYNTLRNILSGNNKSKLTCLQYKQTG